MTSRVFMLAVSLLVSVLPYYCMASDVVKMTDPKMTHALFEKALNEHDIDQLHAIYSDDCVMVLGNGKEMRGCDEMHKLFETWINGVIKIKVETVYSVASGDIVLFRSKYNSTYKDAEGKRHEYVSSGIEIVQQQKDGTWQIVLDHHSGGANIPMVVSDAD